MRGIKDEFRQLDELFRQESEQNQRQEFISATYAAAESTSATLATRRYRKGESRHKTCLDLHISESQYYKLLSKFLSTAKAVHDKLPD